jgi:hypothetical protein
MKIWYLDNATPEDGENNSEEGSRNAEEQQEGEQEEQQQKRQEEGEEGAQSDASKPAAEPSASPEAAPDSEAPTVDALPSGSSPDTASRPAGGKPPLAPGSKQAAAAAAAGKMLRSNGDLISAHLSEAGSVPGDQPSECRVCVGREARDHISRTGLACCPDRWVGRPGMHQENCRPACPCAQHRPAGRGSNDPAAAAHLLPGKPCSPWACPRPSPPSLNPHRAPRRPAIATNRRQ